MILDLAAALALAASCAPAVAPETLLAVMRAESGFHVHAIGVNAGAGEPTRSLRPPTREAAVAAATALLAAGRSVDLGLMQVNSANLARLGLGVADAFDPCRNVAAGARVLREGYARAVPAAGGDAQRALGAALSRYNTGDPGRGLRNGYVAHVQAAAEVVVPAIRLRAATPPEGAGGPPRAETNREGDDDPDAPPSWDVWAGGRLARAPRTAGGTATAGPANPAERPQASAPSQLQRSE